MSWGPNDLVTDVDLEAYETRIFDQFARTEWFDRRQKALEDWLFPLLEANRFDPTRFRTRHAPTAVFGYTSSAYTDKTTAAATSDGLNLAAILATSSDALYLGFEQPFRGALFAIHDSPGSAAARLSVFAWTGAWTAVAGLVDGTRIDTKSLAQGGSLTWTLPEALIRRTVNGSDDLYWVKVTSTTAPTGATAGPVTVIRRSRLAAAVTFRTLALIFREAPTGQDGPWEQKATWYEAEADRAFERVKDAIGPEFDTDNDDAIDGDEETQTAASVSSGGWTMERG